MIVHEVPYEWVERFFGSYIAAHFNTINLILAAVGLVIAILLGRKISLRIKSHQRRSIKIPDGEESVTYPAQHGEWSPTGWTLDHDTKQWNPPDYLAEEAKFKWRWNEEKRIWIDTEKEKRLERNRQWKQAQGKEPSYEEWKAKRKKEE